VTHLAPVVAAHLNDRGLLETVAKATRVCQNNTRAIAFTQATALILRDLLNGGSPESAVAETRLLLKSPDNAWSEVIDRMDMAAANLSLSSIDATMLFGQSCPLYSSFPAALHTTLISSNSYINAIQATANAGGDSAGRVAMIGAWLGAYLGIQAIPEDWRTRLTAHDRIEADVERIVADMRLSAH
jgi:ADP-ribosylglycohydrolase